MNIIFFFIKKIKYIPVIIISFLLSSPTYADPSGGRGNIDDLVGELSVQCSSNPRKLRTIRSLRDRAGLKRGINGLSIAPGDNDQEDSYHCCDADGNCSGDIDALTICPVFKVWCRLENDSCICD